MKIQLYNDSNWISEKIENNPEDRAGQEMIIEYGLLPFPPFFSRSSWDTTSQIDSLHNTLVKMKPLGKISRPP